VTAARTLKHRYGFAEYLRLSQHEPRVEVRTRKGDRFEITTHGPGDRVELTGGVGWSVEELYAR